MTFENTSADSNPLKSQQTVMAPVAAFTMACILFAYTRSSIREAKRSAQHQARHEGQLQQRQREGKE
ncbi:hypothetical protein VTK26DRAFT_3898 [Humicola hyalothermophila]